MPPTGEEDPYPFWGLFGWVHMLELVGTGTQVVVDTAAEVVDALDGVAEATGQV